MKKETFDRFVQPLGSIRKVPRPESFRDLPLAKQRERMRAMYRDLKSGEQ